MPALPPLPNFIPATTGMELEEIESIPSFQHEGNEIQNKQGGDSGVDDDDGVDGSMLGALGSVYKV